MIKNKHISQKSGFTIVELLVVIIVIAILATIGFVQYIGMQDRAREAVLRSDLTAAAEILNIDQVRSGEYPESMDDADRGGGLPASPETEYQYSFDNSTTPPTFCLTGINGPIALYITQDGVIGEGTCDGHAGPVAGGGDEDGGGEGGAAIADGSLMQEITDENCPGDRTRAVDARDNNTYWVQRLDDGKCWMLTNLAYAGGGSAAYGDTKTISYSANGESYTDAYYFISSNANITTEPSNPSVSTDGGSSNPQYGYFYNWCAAMGVQIGTGACASVYTPLPDANVSICPAGWRLPAASEFTALNDAVNGGSTTTDIGLRTIWLGQRGGGYYDYGRGFIQGSSGMYYSSTQSANTAAVYLEFSNLSVNPVKVANSKRTAYPVRCIAG